MSADDLLDTRLREAGDRWRAVNAQPAQVTVSPPRTAAPRHRGVWLSAAAVAVALVAVGAFAQTRHDQPSTPSAATALTGVIWHLTGSSDPSGAARVANPNVLFTIRHGRLVASDDCTLLGGVAHLDGDTLRVDHVIQRTLGCVDQYGLSLVPGARPVLTGPATYQIAGTQLTITKPGRGTLRFAPAPPGTTAPSLDVATITGHSWALRAASDARGHTRAGSGETLGIADDGSFTAIDPCGATSGSAEVNGNVIRFSPIDTTDHSCLPGAQLPTIRAMFAASVKWTITGDTLTLSAGGIGSLVYDLIRSNPVGSWSLLQYERTPTNSVSGGSASVPMTLSFDGSGHYVAKYRCRTTAGTMRIAAQHMFLRESSGTAIPCHQGTSAPVADAVISAVLSGEVGWQVEGVRLTITKQGVGTLTYERS